MAKSSPVAGEGHVGVGATIGEVVAVAAHDDVIADATVDGVVAGPALQDVVNRRGR